MAHMSPTSILAAGSWAPPGAGQKIAMRVAVIGEKGKASAWMGQGAAWTSLTRFLTPAAFEAVCAPGSYDLVVDEGGAPVAERVELMLRAVEALAPGGVYAALSPGLRVGAAASSPPPQHLSLLDACLAIAVDVAGDIGPVRARGACKSALALTAISPDLARRTLRETVAAIDIQDGVVRIVKAGSAAAVTLHVGDLSPGPLAAAGAGPCDGWKLTDNVVALEAENARLALRLRRVERDNSALAERARHIDSSWALAVMRTVTQPLHLPSAIKAGVIGFARRVFHLCLRIPALRRLAVKLRETIRRTPTG